MSTTILHIIGQLTRGGAERQLFMLCKALQKRNWRQSVVSFSSGGVWKEHFEAAGIPVCEIPQSIFKPWRLWQLRRCVKTAKANIVLSWSPHVAVYARWLGNIRRIVNVRGDLGVNSNTGGFDPMLRWCRGAIQNADYVVSNSHHGLNVLQQAGMTIPRSEVIRNIVPAFGRATPAELVESPRIAAVGSLKPLKAYDVLLHALKMLATEGRKFELLLAGDGPERGNLEALVGQLGLTDRVRFLGDVDDVPGLLATAHIFVHPSKSESLSNAILEAMAEGLPVVASNVGGNPEIVKDGRTGLLVSPGQPNELAFAIHRLLDDTSVRDQFGKAGLESVQTHCVEQIIADQYEAIFSRLS
jgi:glycosyltransferase involved in cell wall biosynthesis